MSRSAVVVAVGTLALAACAEQRPFLVWNARPPAPALQGRVAVVGVRNSRPPKQGGTNPNQVGNNRAPAGIPYPVRLESDTALTDSLTRIIGEAAASAGLGVTQPTDSAATALLSGNLEEFWCDGYPPVFNVQMKLGIDVLDPATKQPRTHVTVLRKDGGPSCEDAIRELMNNAYDEIARALAQRDVHVAAVAPTAVAQAPAQAVVPPGTPPAAAVPSPLPPPPPPGPTSATPPLPPPPGAPAPPAAAATPPASAASDTVDLLDGTSITGHIIQQAPGQYVIIRQNGHDITLMWNTIRRITASAPGAAAPAAPAEATPPPPPPPPPPYAETPPPPPPPYAGTPAPAGSPEAPPLPPPPGVAPTDQTQAGALPPPPPPATPPPATPPPTTPPAVAPVATPAPAVATPSLEAGLPPRPGRVIAGGVLDGVFVYGSGPGVYGAGLEGGFSMGVNFMPSFVSAKGGTWNGLEFEALGGLYGGGQTASGGKGVFMFSLELALGYQFLYLGALDSSKKQHGVGVFAGFAGGFQDSEVIDVGNAVDGAVGGIVELMFPTYHATRRKLSRAFIKFQARALPAADVVIYGIGGGAAF